MYKLVKYFHFLCFIACGLQNQISAQIDCELTNIQVQITNVTGATIDKGASNISTAIANGNETLGSDLEITATNCGEIRLEIDLSYNWTQGLIDIAWIHGISFNASPGWDAFGAGNIGEGWSYYQEVTGNCSGNTYYDGYFYDLCEENFPGPGDCGSCSPEECEICRSPEDNYGIDCEGNGCPSFSFRLRYCPYEAGTRYESISFFITNDGESGAWSFARGCYYLITYPIKINSGGITTANQTIGPGCPETCYTLDAGQGCNGYTWSTGETGQSIEVCPTESTTYNVTVSSCGPDIVGDFMVEVRDLPDPNILVSPSNMIDCNVESITLSVDNPQQDIAYSWKINGVIIPNQTTIEVANAGDVTLIALDTLTLCSTETVETIIGLEDYPSVIFNEPVDLNCLNETVVIDASNSAIGENYILQWLDENMQPIIGQNDIINEVDQAGVYYLQNTNTDTGCEVIGSIEIIENYTSPIIDLEENVVIPCNSDELLLNTNIIGTNSSALTYEWSLEGEIIDFENNKNPILNQPGMYTLVVTDSNNGCSDSALVNLQLQIDLAFELDISTSHSPCGNYADGQITINEVLGGEPPFEYRINDSIIESNSLENLTAGLYNIEVIDANECLFQETIDLPEGSNLTLDASSNNIFLKVDDQAEIDLQTNVNLNEIFNLFWSEEEGVSCVDCLNDIIINPEISTDYIVTIIDENGCQDSTIIRVTKEIIPNIYLPTVFNPNINDSNNYFSIFTDDKIVQVSSFNIYDRWGNLVFYKENFIPNNPSLGWDGKTEGQNATPGVYVYIIELEDIYGDIQIEVGNITLIE